MDDQIRTELEAAAFRGLVAHLKKRSDVQNIDLMNLAGFCRNCLSKWYRAAGEGRGIDITYDEAREIIYGMSYEEWKKNYIGSFELDLERVFIKIDNNKLLD